MEVTYELTQRDYFDSFDAHRNRSAFSRWTFRLIFYAPLLIGGMGLLLLAVRPNAETIANLVPAFAMTALLAIFFWACPRWVARNQYLKQPGARGPKTVLVDAAGVHSRWNGGSSDVEWKNFIRHLESKRQFLLYLSPYLFQIVPKRALTPEQLAEFRTLLAQNLSQGR